MLGPLMLVAGCGSRQPSLSALDVPPRSWRRLARSGKARAFICRCGARRSGPAMRASGRAPAYTSRSSPGLTISLRGG
jgi:hypothetical protein